jgi:ferrous iron transport protein A
MFTPWHDGSIHMVLAEVKKNGVYHVKQLHGIGDVHRHLEDLGFLPGESIRVISRIGGNLVVSVKGSRVALSSELAKNIVI